MAQVYERHRPEDTALHQIVGEHLEEFLRASREESGRPLPRFVERAFRAYLACGLPSAGFTRLVCAGCRRESILAFSCKTRLLCPSCAARHMGDGAAHFLDQMLPDVPYRQVVVSLPFEVRGLLAFRPPVLRAAVRLIDDTVMAWQRQRSRGRVGGVAVLQRAGGSLNIHPHVHMLVADGAWHEQPNGTLRFEPTPAPTLDEVGALAERIARRLTKMFRRRGLTIRPDEAPAPPEAPDPLAGCIEVALGPGHRDWQEPALPIAADEPPRPRPRDPPLCAIAQGVNVHAGVVVPAGDRAALERLVRYLLRPALSLKRLSLRDEDVVVYRLQRPDRRGRTALVMTPLELLARLAACAVWHARPSPRAPAPARALLTRLPGPQEGHARPGAPSRLSRLGPGRPHPRALGRAAAPCVACRGPTVRALRGTPAPGRGRAGPRGGGALPAGQGGVHNLTGRGALSRPSPRGSLST